MSLKKTTRILTSEIYPAKKDTWLCYNLQIIKCSIQFDSVFKGYAQNGCQNFILLMKKAKSNIYTLFVLEKFQNGVKIISGWSFCKFLLTSKNFVFKVLLPPNIKEEKGICSIKNARTYDTIQSW